MNAGVPEAQQIQVDVLPPVPADAYSSAGTAVSTQPPIPFAGLRTFYHPAAGVVILGLDWLAFGTDMLSGFLALPLICILSFLMTLPALYVIQSRWGQDKPALAFGKALLGAVLVALPFPITGTLLGAAVLALAGLPHHPVEMLKRLNSSVRSTK